MCCQIFFLVTVERTGIISYLEEFEMMSLFMFAYLGHNVRQKLVYFSEEWCDVAKKEFLNYKGWDGF